MGIFRVIGRHNYRGHRPGETFDATLDPAAVERAVAIGALEVIDGRRTELRPGSWTLPDGWQTPATRAPDGALSLKGA